MSSVKTITIRTNVSGAYSWERYFTGVIDAIELEIGDLSTPDFDVTDETHTLTLVSVNGVAATTVYYPSTFLEAADGTSAALVGTAMKGATSFPFIGSLKVAVTGAGDTKTGHVRILYH
jgi:hypothetical protein